ncbi:MAG TPA: GAP family protein [Thermoleophilaceae bacterium]|nr:GAP family protein [Thermoleophilaceae bacterium]
MPYQALPLALAAAFFPFGLIVFTLLVSSEPFRARAVSFLAGALAMTFGCGVVGVTLAHDLDLAGVRGSHHVSGVVDIAVGALLLIAFVVIRRRPAKERAAREPAPWIRALMRSPLLAFLLGAGLYAPSPLYLGALTIVADAGLSTAGDVVWVAILTVIVTSLIEVPVILMLREPERGRAGLVRLNGWMSSNGRALLMWLVLAAGVYLVVRGVARVSAL